MLTTSSPGRLAALGLDGGCSADSRAEELADGSGEGGGSWQAEEDVSSGENWGGSWSPDPSSPSRVPRVSQAICNGGARCPHQQLLWATWELQEVDIEQKQH